MGREDRKRFTKGGKGFKQGVLISTGRGFWVRLQVKLVLALEELPGCGLNGITT